MGLKSEYSIVDRALHRLAFATRIAQVGLSDIESKLFSATLTGIKVEDPVFVAGLPRSGTTILLELLVGTDEFGSHTYRDMPFVLLPMLWDRFSRRFDRDDVPRERAHGDGMLIDSKSPEAFEEMLWSTFWPSHYLEDRITPWEIKGDAEFEEYFREHLRKIVALRQSGSEQAIRYVSKNNLNIARIPYIKQFLSDATIVVPFRAPIEHAVSLHKQHMNFLRIHRESPFASAYMRGVGHFDFGDNLKPVDFDDWLQSGGPKNATTLQFWLEYWISAYRHLYDLPNEKVSFLCYENLCEHPEKTLRKLGEVVRISNPDRLISQAGRLTRKKPFPVGNLEVTEQAFTESADLYHKLCERDRIT